MATDQKNITPRDQDFSKWYLDVIAAAELADYAPVKGCMVIRPNGYAIWENMHKVLDGMFKATGHQNAYFPLFIPQSFLEKEAEHVEGFALECAVVTHTGLAQGDDGKLKLRSPLEEPLICRPTSETVIWSMYKNWIQSHRDLPILINQWANVIRWEMRTRLFLRTAEFLWQEGHTAHATKEEAVEETLKMLEVYRDFAENYMAMPVITGRKTENEKFAGAVDTYSIEAMMQDKRALQSGTSHFLGQNFAKAFDVTFQDEAGNRDYVWATSWGVSTRLIGGLIMTHSDDKGLVLPPKLAPLHVVIVPIYKDDNRDTVIAAARQMKDNLKLGLLCHIDERDNYRPGFKFNEWEKRGVPIRIELGPKDIEKDQCVLVRRDTGEKEFVPQGGLNARITDLLTDIQDNLFKRAKEYRDNNMVEIDTWDEFVEHFKQDQGSFAMCHWDGTTETEVAIQEATKATIRCIPLDQKQEAGRCVKTGNPSTGRVVFAKAY